jgi:monoamine oxidase
MTIETKHTIMKQMKTHTVIVGAGYSGIAAARILHLQNTEFILLEARDRIGGRVYTRQFGNDLYLDLGGQWVGPTQHRMYELLNEYGVKYFETYNQGKNILDLNGKIKTYKGLIPSTDILSLLNLDYVIRKIERMAKSIDVSAPYNHPKAEEYDAQTLADFIEKNCKTENCKKIIRAGMETVFACELHEVSLLHALFYVKSGTSLDCLLNIKNGAQQDRIEGGMQLLANRITEQFADKLRLNAPVTSVEQNAEGVIVKGADYTIQAQNVIMAIPPHLCANISFAPPLPDDKQQVMNSLPMGLVAKCFMVYDKPFWRNKGFSGQVVSDQNAPFQTVFDASPNDGSKGILLGFNIADRNRAFFALPENERKQKAIDYYVKCFGAEAANPLMYVDYSMKDDQWSGGCYAALYPQGVWTQYRNAFARREGNIYFAGTETAEVWFGYIEGAVRAGERAAREVLNP